MERDVETGEGMKGADLTGVMCATVTPFNEDGFDVDWDGIAANADWLVGQGVRVLVVNGSIGEYTALGDAERRQAVELTVSAAAGRARVVVGCSHNSPRQAVELCRHAERAGADAVMVMAPSYFRLPDYAVADFFAYLTARVGPPVLVYNNPAISQAELSLAAVASIADLPGVIGLKEASGQVNRYLKLRSMLGPEFPIIAANESCLYHALTAGADGCMTASAAFAPQLLTSIVDAVARGDLAGARAQWARLSAFRDLMQADIAVGVPAYIPYTKAAMTMVGLRGGYPHFPLSPLRDEETARLRRVLTADMGLELADGTDHSPARRARDDGPGHDGPGHDIERSAAQ